MSWHWQELSNQQECTISIIIPLAVAPIYSIVSLLTTHLAHGERIQHNSPFAFIKEREDIPTSQ